MYYNYTAVRRICIYLTCIYPYRVPLLHLVLLYTAVAAASCGCLPPLFAIKCRMAKHVAVVHWSWSLCFFLLNKLDLILMYPLAVLSPFWPWFAYRNTSLVIAGMHGAKAHVIPPRGSTPCIYYRIRIGLFASVADRSYFNLAVRPNELRNVIWGAGIGPARSCHVVHKKKLAIGEYRGILSGLDAVVHINMSNAILPNKLTGRWHLLRLTTPRGITYRRVGTQRSPVSSIICSHVPGIYHAVKYKIWYSQYAYATFWGSSVVWACQE